MSYRTILVHADSGPGAESRIRLAARLAERNDASLIGAAARLPTPLLQVYAGGAAMISAGLLDAGNAEIDDALKAAEADFLRWTAGFGLDTEWRSAIDFPALAIASLAAAADLVVIGGANGPVPHGADPAFDAGDLVMKSGRPVLVVPAACDNLDARNVVVAWKNTREARRALSDALPFLKQAETVALLHVAEEGEESAAAALADALLFLKNHAIEATAETLAQGGRSAAEQILGVAAKKNCGLIVAGAYGHTRLREWAFGGVTRELLGRCPVPCLFSR
ncbi:MAG: universal stress protein [Bauldia sp.]|nr:universal stress protein [Bauldia sp.]